MDDENNHPHPIDRLKQTFFVWLFYSMFTRMTIGPTIVAFILLCSYYLVLDLIEYHKSNDNEEYACYNIIKGDSNYITEPSHKKNKTDGILFLNKYGQKCQVGKNVESTVSIEVPKLLRHFKCFF